MKLARPRRARACDCAPLARRGCRAVLETPTPPKWLPVTKKRCLSPQQRTSQKWAQYRVLEQCIEAFWAIDQRRSRAGRPHGQIQAVIEACVKRSPPIGREVAKLEIALDLDAAIEFFLAGRNFFCAPFGPDAALPQRSHGSPYSVGSDLLRP